ncbi:dihydrofolate reductase family protein [Microtetraspora sp. NBRC 16547]|uniref:dihydrofolate reductase family protein n=1 Tax=Microtetraspora sp. NBRC 16547 TaxID=3030993 RepID=UPI0024A119EC|nr:dihydrofolate reductase family protein [Microtetraspora sp. NBRC 16547]GLX00269.1 hypothetical protein Misp02_43550 [Microtetraspora sp. NBRC 16547]
MVGGDDVYDQLRALKADQNLGITGSGTLVRSLLAEGLLDELHLLVITLIHKGRSTSNCYVEPGSRARRIERPLLNYGQLW